MANAYDYALRHRPPNFATLPPGWELIARGASFNPVGRPDLPVDERNRFGVVRYRRPLSKSEMETYELEPV